MVTAGILYSDIKRLLKENNIDNHIFESRCIFEHATGLNNSRLIANPDQTIPDDRKQLVYSMVEKRISGYPLQYLIGTWEFFGLPFRVGDGVLIPRQDTETLVESVLSRISEHPVQRITDLCSGSGCIPVAIEKYTNGTEISAVEYSEKALGYLRENIALNCSSVRIHKGDVLDSEFCKQFNDIDIITSNPPYLTPEDMNVLQKEVRFEPEMALLGGNDGLLFYRTITHNWKHCLKTGGMIFYEIGIGQENAVSDILASNGFTDIQIIPDLCGVNRVVCGVYNK